MARTLVCSTLLALSAYGRILAQDTGNPSFTIAPLQYEPYAGTLLPLELRPQARSRGTVNDHLPVSWHSSDPLTAWVDDNGVVVLLKAGKVTISVRQGTTAAVREIRIAENPVRRLALRSARTRLAPGDTVSVVADARDGEARAVRRIRPNFSVIGDGASVDGDGRFVARVPGTFLVVAELGGVSAVQRLEVGGPSLVQQGIPAGVSIDLHGPRHAPYAGTTVAVHATVRGAEAAGRQAVRPVWTVSDTSLARIDEHGTLQLLKPGRVKVAARVGAASAEETIRVLANPVADVALRLGDADVRVGDRVQVTFDAWVHGGQHLDNPSVLFAVSTADGSTRAATISESGVFVAREPGVYTIMAAIGEKADRQTVLVRPR